MQLLGLLQGPEIVTGVTLSAGPMPMPILKAGQICSYASALITCPEVGLIRCESKSAR